jgi:hypothetical protein
VEPLRCTNNGKQWGGDDRRVSKDQQSFRYHQRFRSSNSGRECADEKGSCYESKGVTDENDGHSSVGNAVMSEEVVS